MYTFGDIIPNPENHQNHSDADQNPVKQHGVKFQCYSNGIVSSTASTLLQVSVMFKRKVLKTELHIIMKLKNRNDTILFDMGHGFDIFGSEMNL